MSYCLIKSEVEKLKQAIRDGRLNPEKLAEMSSEDTRAFLETVLSKENAKQVNLLYEKKLLLKNQERGVANLFKDLAGLSEKEKAERSATLLKNLEEKKAKIWDPGEGAKQLNEVISDIYSRKYRTGISLEETTKIYEMSKKVDEAKLLISPDSPNGSSERINYGINYILRSDYVGDIISDSKRIQPKEYLLPANWGKGIANLGGMAKSMLSTLDNSFFGTQGIKMMWDAPDLWGKQFIKSFDNIGKELKGEDAMLPIKADIFSRQNAIDGIYQKAKLDIGINSEEQFPSSLPERIPYLGRVFKGAESAFNGAALRLRADYFDRQYKWANETGLDVSDKNVIEGLGKISNSMTGRGDLGKLSAIGKELNELLFAGKFFKSNLDTLTAHIFDKDMPKELKVKSAKSLLKIIGGTAAIMTTANILSGGQAAESDPRSSMFGKIKVGTKTIDITGKMGSIVTLASRLVPTLHNGQWGFWTKSNDGSFRDLADGKYGAQTAMDVFDSFWEGKLSPLTGLARDIWKGKNYSGNKVNPLNALYGLTVPMGVQQNIQNWQDNPSDPNNIMFAILDTIGFQTNVAAKTGAAKADISNSSSAKIQQFKSKVSSETFNNANNDIKTKYQSYLDQLNSNPKYQALSDADKLLRQQQAKIQAENKILKQYNFKYKPEAKEKIILK
jgi:hypothetical protein